jgi:hypothetical protein
MFSEIELGIVLHASADDLFAFTNAHNVMCLQVQTYTTDWFMSLVTNVFSYPVL